MIVFKNDIEEAEENPKEPISFQINETDVTLTKNYPMIYDKIKDLNENQNESETIQITIPDLNISNIIKKDDISKRYGIDDDDYYREIYRESRGYSQYSDYSRRDGNYINVFQSNFDNRDINEKKNYDFGYDRPYYINSYRLRSDDDGIINKYYYDNKMITISDIPNLSYFKKQVNTLENKKFIAIDQFQLVLDGYDILIPDFIVDDMLKIAEKFQIQELIDAIDPLKKEIDDMQNYNRFSELEILINLEDVLTSINDDNFNSESSIIFSIFLYLGKNFLRSILTYYSFLYPSKYHIYLKIAQMIDAKYDNFSFNVNFEQSIHTQQSYYERNEYESYLMRMNPIHINNDLMHIIKKDDFDSLQKLSCNPKFKFAEEVIILQIYDCFKNSSLSPRCNAIECAAFYGSLKCFKFLLLNEKLSSIELAKYAIAGGNTEIIHICEQNKCNFRNTLKIAIDYHQNDIAEWIVDNDKDSIREDIYDACIRANNFDMLQFFLGRKSESTLNNAKLTARYILYVKHNYNYNDIHSSSFIDFLMKYKSMKYSDEFGLIYCPNEKVELIQMNLSESHECSRILDSPVMKAAYYGDLEMCKFLFKNRNIDKYSYVENDDNDDDDDDNVMYEYYNQQIRRRTLPKPITLKSNIMNDLSGNSIQNCKFNTILVQCF